MTQRTRYSVRSDIVSGRLPLMERIQVNIRLEPAVVAAVDLVAAEEGRTRAEVVRDAVIRRLRAAADDRAATAYAQAYRERPETDDELDRSTKAALRLTAEEPWERWW